MKDGSGQLAPRPEITGAPATLGYDGAFNLTDARRTIRKLALVRLGAPTHSQDQSQRYIPLTFTRVRHDADRRRPEQPARGARRALHAVRDRRRRRAVDGLDRPAPAPGRDAPRPPRSTSRSTRPPPAAPRASAARRPPRPSTARSRRRNSDKFCTKVTGTRQLTVDLGSSQPVNRFVIKHAGAGGESTAMNTRAYRIETRTSSHERVEHRGHRHRQHGEHDDQHDHDPQCALRPARHHGLRAGHRRPAPPASTSSRSTTAPARAVPSAPAILYSGAERDRPRAALPGRRLRRAARQPRRDRQRRSRARSTSRPATRRRSAVNAGLAQRARRSPAGRYNTLPPGYDLALSSLRVRGPAGS